MSIQALTIHLPDGLYLRLQQRAQAAHRTLEEELVEVLNSVVTEDEALPPSLSQELAHLATLSDVELRRAATMRLPRSEAARLDALHLKRQQEDLTESEVSVLAGLVEQYERFMLVRARAAALLKQRGHNTSDLTASP